MHLNLPIPVPHKITSFILSNKGQGKTKQNTNPNTAVKRQNVKSSPKLHWFLCTADVLHFHSVFITELQNILSLEGPDL